MLYFIYLCNLIISIFFCLKNMVRKNNKSSLDIIGSCFGSYCGYLCFYF